MDSATAAIKLCQQLTGHRQVVCRPLLANVPDFPGATLVDCGCCGCACWKTPMEPESLPDGVTAACTACALRAGMNRSK